MKKVKSIKKPSAKASKPQKAVKKKTSPPSGGKGKLKKDWQEKPALDEEEVNKTEEEESFADEQEPKLENLDDALLDEADDAEEEDFYNEDSSY